MQVRPELNAFSAERVDPYGNLTSSVICLDKPVQRTVWASGPDQASHHAASAIHLGCLLRIQLSNQHPQTRMDW
jgi:hypothetical protein